MDDFEYDLLMNETGREFMELANRLQQRGVEVEAVIHGMVFASGLVAGQVCGDGPEDQEFMAQLGMLLQQGLVQGMAIRDRQAV